MNRVGVVAALVAEARALSPAIKCRGVPFTLTDGTLLIVSGIGHVAATRASFALIDAGADALVSFGLAGGLDPTLPAGAIFLPSEIICAQEPALPTSLDWRERVGQALASSAPIVRGPLLSSPKAMTGVHDKAEAFRATGALAVDMESIAVARVATARGLPFLAVRVIVDTANDALPRAVMAASVSGTVRIGRLIGALLRAPGDVMGLIRLAQRFRIARRALRAAAASHSLREAVIG